MYRIGFGDCFLLSLPNGDNGSSRDSHAHILVDCGVHSRGNIGTMERIVGDIAEVTGKRLAAVIASHAHQDHISGFDKFGKVFSTFEIGEVWLPWTWNPNDQTAVQLQKKQAALTTHLNRQFRSLAAANPNSVTAAALEAINNLKGNEHAVALLNAGFGVNARVRYLKAGEILGNDEVNGSRNSIPIPGLSVQVLGPPTSTEFLAQMNPGKDHYLRVGPEGEASDQTIQPIASKWIFDPGKSSGGPVLSAAEEKELQNLTGSSLENLAFALDQARNNESLVTLFIFRDQYLLFPGDAQYGNWQWWLENLHPENILPKLSFIKIAHHGSINATPKSAIDQLTMGKAAAMVSTQSVPWHSIPYVPAMTAYDEKTEHKVVRSDWLPIADGPTPLKDTTPKQPARLPDGFTQGTLWFDYFIRL
jgi:hypothetical protein